LIVKVTDDSGHRIFFIGENGTSVQASRIDTMVTGGCDGLLEGSSPVGALEQADIAPTFSFIQTIQRMTCRDACLAAAAFVEIHLKAKLLTFSRL
jgi:hypothetical protein